MHTACVCRLVDARDGSEVRGGRANRFHATDDDGEQSHTRKQTILSDDNVARAVTAAGGRTRSSSGDDSFSEKSSAANDRDREWCVCVRACGRER